MSEPALEGSRTRVVIVDDDVNLRVSLRQILSSEPDFVVVGEADLGEAAVEVTKTLLPDAVLLDSQALHAGSDDAAPRLIQELPSLRVIGLDLVELRNVAPTMAEAGSHLSLEKNPLVERLLADLRSSLT